MQGSVFNERSVDIWRGRSGGRKMGSARGVMGDSNANELKKGNVG